MPLQQTTGNVTTDAYGGGVAAVPNYIEDVFSTYLYTGDGTGQSIVNGIDLSTKGGMVWAKSRSSASTNRLFDTNRGATKEIYSDSTAAQATNANGLTAFNSNGFTLGSSAPNVVGVTYASWTFRKQPKFFDVVTYTGNGVAGRTVAHSLGSVPGCIFVKCTTTGGAGYDWAVYHQNLTSASYFMLLNSTQAEGSNTSYWNGVAPTSTQFTVGTSTRVNQSGQTYVAYIFAHNAGGFGLTGTDNVISCGSFTGSNVNNVDVTLGYEPQWILWRTSNSVDSWKIADNMRGMPVGSGSSSSTANLFPNSSSAETVANGVSPTATGFTWYANGAVGLSDTYIYIAIRRGPMKVPTGGTSVYYTDTSRSAVSGSTPSWVSGFVTDMAFGKIVGNVANMNIASRLTGTGQLFTNATSAEGTDATYTWDFMQGWGSAGSASSTFASWMFRRAPGFFDEVCYTGDGGTGTRTITHNLTVAPELIIVKCRNNIANWVVGNTNIGWTRILNLSTTAASTLNSAFANTAPTSSVFSLRKATGDVNEVGWTYVAYLFATCAGVSKVGSYTGNGSSQTINCGFTGGARFVLIKRTDSTGDWYVYDTARGMTTLTDPYLLLNSTAAESATLGSVTTVTTGFAVDASILAAVNTNAASYIFLAIA